MLVNKAYSFRIYPNKAQKIVIAKTIGWSRFYLIISCQNGRILTKKLEKD